MVIKMLSDKSLVYTNKTRIFQRESLVDKVTILVPQKYEDEDISTYSATATYVDSNNVLHVETLDLEEDLYKEYLQFHFSVDSHFTYAAGTTRLTLVFTKYDESTETKYVLRSGDIEVEVLRLNEFFTYSDDTTISALEQKIMELQTETDKLLAAAEIVTAKQVDDIALDTDTDKLHLTINGQMTGKGQEIVVPNIRDKYDGSDDGVIDIDNYDEDSGGDEDDPDQYYQFIDLG